MDPLNFYFDVSVGRCLPEALSLLFDRKHIRIYHHNTNRKELGLPSTGKHKSLFKEGEQDDVWLEFVGKQNWVVFTQDGKFHKPGFENELSAIKQFNVGCFYIWGACSPRHEKAQSLLKAMDNVKNAIQATPKPFIYKIHKNGRLVAVNIP